jgi:hypothetical protein
MCQHVTQPQRHLHLHPLIRLNQRQHQHRANLQTGNTRAGAVCVNCNAREQRLCQENLLGSVC